MKRASCNISKRGSGILSCNTEPLRKRLTIDTSRRRPTGSDRRTPRPQLPNQSAGLQRDEDARSSADRPVGVAGSDSGERAGTAGGVPVNQR